MTLPRSLLQEFLDQLDPDGSVEGDDAPEGWEKWLPALLPRWFSVPFAPHHRQIWDWGWAIEPLVRPRPLVGIIARGGGKSSTAEAKTVSLGARRIRRYAWYISATQEQADDHVANIASVLESPEFERYYPSMAERMIGKYGQSKGWRRQRLRTASGFTVDALGLDTASRGAKVENERPDLIVLDDIDEEHDTIQMTERKIRTLTRAILPAGSSTLAVLAIQNLVIQHGIFARLAGIGEHRADFLADRIVVGPVPAARNLVTRTEKIDELGTLRTVVVKGEPTWEGQSLDVIQSQIDAWGWDSFEKESQHVLGDRPNALWTRERIDANRVDDTPRLDRIVIGVDPHATVGRTGIVAAGVRKASVEGGRDHGYTLEDATSDPGSKPEVWGLKVLELAYRWKADSIVAEVNQGGDMVAAVLRGLTLRAGDLDPTAEDPDKILLSGDKVPFRSVHASRGKVTRAEPVSVLAKEGRSHHVGRHTELENQMCRWIPGEESPNNLDAMVWAYWDLIIEEEDSRPVVEAPSVNPEDYNLVSIRH